MPAAYGPLGVYGHAARHSVLGWPSSMFWRSKRPVSSGVRGLAVRVGEGAVDADPLEVRRLRSGAAQQRSSPAIAGARWLNGPGARCHSCFGSVLGVWRASRPKLLAARVLHMYYPASRLARPAP